MLPFWMQSVDDGSCPSARHPIDAGCLENHSIKQPSSSNPQTGVHARTIARASSYPKPNDTVKHARALHRRSRFRDVFGVAFEMCGARVDV
jgi:hypothetical protein